MSLFPSLQTRSSILTSLDALVSSNTLDSITNCNFNELAVLCVSFRFSLNTIINMVNAVVSNSIV